MSHEHFDPNNYDHDKYARIAFNLEVDEDGWPPENVETMWARKENGELVLDNIPFFAKEVSCQDVIEATMEDGMLTFQRVVERAGHNTVRLILYDKDRVDSVRSDLIGLGCAVEKSGYEKLITVDIPPNVDSELVRAYLYDGAESEVFDYEEADVSWVSEDDAATDGASDIENEG